MPINHPHQRYGDPAADQEHILGLTRDQLREELRHRGLSVAGNKNELVERLAGSGEADDEVFGDVRRAARQLSGILSDRGVPVDRVLAAFRAYTEGGSVELQEAIAQELGSLRK